jgi:hypothetical protein
MVGLAMTGANILERDDQNITDDSGTLITDDSDVQVVGREYAETS